MSSTQTVTAIIRADVAVKSSPRTSNEGSSLTGRRKMRPELRLLLASARTETSVEASAVARRLLKKRIDWDYFFRIANRHFVAPLVSFNLLSRFSEWIPPEIQRSARIGLQAHTGQNLFLAHELIRLIGLLEGNGIAVLPFKGPTLAMLAYKSLSLRQFSDLDILVAKRDVRKARGLLSTEGYCSGIGLTRLQKWNPTWTSRKDLVLVHPVNNVRIELHWRLTGSYFCYTAKGSFWNTPDRLSIAGCAVRTLPPQQLLSYLCVHGSRHSWERLSWICDVAELLRVHPNWDWPQIVKEAVEGGNWRSLALGLCLAHDLLDAPVPKEVMNGVWNDGPVRELAVQIQGLLLDEGEERRSLDIGYLYAYHLKMKERRMDRIKVRCHYYGRYFQLLVRPSAQDRSGVALRAHLSFVSYFTRPFRLAGLYGTAVIGRFFGVNKKM